MVGMGEKRGKKKGGITISMYSVGQAQGGLCDSRQVVILQHLTVLMDSDCEGICVGNLVTGGA